MRRIRSAAGLLVVVGLLSAAGTAAFGSSATSGPIKVWVRIPVTGGNVPDPVVITGVIGDFGTTLSVNSKGKADANGNYERIRLVKGKFTVNGSALNQALSSAMPSDFNSSTCSGSFSAGPETVPIVNGSGTGAYAGITGSVDVSAQFAFVQPKKKNGSCNMNANPAGGWGVITGAGTVSF